MGVRKTMVTAALAALLALPLTGQALHNVVTPECEGLLATDGTGSCSATFTLEEAHFPSVRTHAGFHELLALDGAVTAEWRDAAGFAVYRTTCAAPGLSTDRGIGALESHNAHCTSEILRQTFVAGVQTLVVTAASSGCPLDEAEPCKFHGQLSLSPPNSPL